MIVNNDDVFSIPEQEPISIPIAIQPEPTEPILKAISQALGFSSILATTTTINSGVRTESAEIKVPEELKGRRFMITNIHISAISSTAAALSAGDNLLVGLMLNGMSILMGASQAINGVTISLDMFPVPLNNYIAATNIASRKAQYLILSQVFNNITRLKIVYSHKSTNTVHYLIYLTIGGVIL